MEKDYKFNIEGIAYGGEFGGVHWEVEGTIKADNIKQAMDRAMMKSFVDLNNGNAICNGDCSGPYLVTKLTLEAV